MTSSGFLPSLEEFQIAHEYVPLFKIYEQFVYTLTWVIWLTSTWFVWTIGPPKVQLSVWSLGTLSTIEPNLQIPISRGEQHMYVELIIGPSSDDGFPKYEKCWRKRDSKYHVEESSIQHESIQGYSGTRMLKIRNCIDPKTQHVKLTYKESFVIKELRKQNT